jgi:hypothetical protein
VEVTLEVPLDEQISPPTVESKGRKPDE